jgi:hypothetical protein
MMMFHSVIAQVSHLTNSSLAPASPNYLSEMRNRINAV